MEGFGGQYLYQPGGGSLHPSTHETVDQKMHYIHQDGQQVFKYAVKKMSEMTTRLLERNEKHGADIDCFISHQANLRIISATADRLKMPREKVIVNIDRFGNTTAGTIPLAMSSEPVSPAAPPCCAGPSSDPKRSNYPTQAREA